jgi:hypothetical protein
MTLMDGATRRKLILEAKKCGGIAIPHMKLQVHQNGAKFPISKVYVTDEQLDPDTFYTLVIIPEGLVSRLTGVMLSFFNPLKGPTIFASIPADILNQELKDACHFWMESKDLGFFMASSGELFGLNYAFEIESKRSRYGKESLMFSFLTNTKQSVFIEDIVSSIFAEYAEKMKNEPDMYNAFHMDDEKNLDDVDKADLEETRKHTHERVLILLNSLKVELDRSLEIQEKFDMLGSGGKKSIELDDPEGDKRLHDKIVDRYRSI